MIRTINEKTLKQGRAFYVVEAALEYLLSILVSGTFLARLSTELGISDSLTGILSSVITLGCLFELFSVFFRGRHMKPLVVSLSILNQLLFLLLYVIPLTGLSVKMKTVLFAVMILLAYVIYYAIHPKKIDWLMSLVDDNKRGRFTATKEMVSLAAGIVFSFGMGKVVDIFYDRGEIRTAFILSSAVMGVLMIFHTLSMLLTVEKPTAVQEKTGFLKYLKESATNKAVLSVSVLLILYEISNCISVSFYGTYQIKELGFSQIQVVTMVSVGALSRILISRFWGWYADRFSFAKMMEICMVVEMFSYLSVVFANPSNGTVCFYLYNILSGVAVGGLNSGMINLIFDYVPPEKRADSLAFSQAFSGLAGFLSTLAVSPLVNRIQNAGNRVLGIPMYAQQLLSGVSVLMIVALLIYVRVVFPQKNKTT